MTSLSLFNVLVLEVGKQSTSSMDEKVKKISAVHFCPDEALYSGGNHYFLSFYIIFVFVVVSFGELRSASFQQTNFVRTSNKSRHCSGGNSLFRWGGGQTHKTDNIANK